jgi:hypothetical protein
VTAIGLKRCGPHPRIPVGPEGATPDDRRKGCGLTFFNLKHRPTGSSGWDGMQPPPLTVTTVLSDLRWQLALYRADHLPVRTILAFLVLRAIHLVEYYRGWTLGSKDA